MYEIQVSSIAERPAVQLVHVIVMQRLCMKAMPVVVMQRLCMKAVRVVVMQRLCMNDRLAALQSVLLYNLCMLL